MNFKNFANQVSVTPSILSAGMGVLSQPLSLDSYDTSSVRAWEASNNFVKKYEVIETSEDVLALSCAWHRLRVDRANGGGPYISISTVLQKELFDYITIEDREKADIIRDYYSKKIMMWRLKEKRLTPYREDLNTFIHDNSKKISEKMLPLAYRLPEFYSYDVEFEEMTSGLAKHPSLIAHPGSKLTPLKKLTIGKRSNKQAEYWFKDINDNVHLILVNMNNPLKHIWDTMFDSGVALSITGTTSKKFRDELQYLEYSKWKII